MRQQPTRDGVQTDFHMDRKSASRLLTTLLLVASALWSVTAQELTLPNACGSPKHRPYVVNAIR
jgi:hypothetical protein